MTNALRRLMKGEDLADREVFELFLMILDGTSEPEQIAALLVAMGMKGETGDELAGAARAVRQLGNRLSLSIPAESILDTCGTGGDESRTFNISTATSLVVASAGIPVVKHGNRAVSSSSGSADVLSLLGVNTSLLSNEVDDCFRGSGMAFCLAPLYHPVLKQVAVIRQKLRVPTIFNRLGPLCNPAGAANQLIGVGKVGWLKPMAEATQILGIRRAFLV
ncbi:MAG: anthranilate phosphoribosyltransferase, partial [Gemmataceae bacterium]